MNKHDKQILETSKAFLGSIELLNAEIERAYQGIEHWKNTVHTLNDKLHELKEANEALLKDFKRIEKDNYTLATKNGQLNEQIAFLERKVERLSPKKTTPRKKVTRKVRSKK